MCVFFEVAIHVVLSFVCWIVLLVHGTLCSGEWARIIILGVGFVGREDSWRFRHSCCVRGLLLLLLLLLLPLLVLCWSLVADIMLIMFIHVF